MKKELPSSGYARRPDADDENEHEKNRLIKSQQERILRKQLSRLRLDGAEPDEIEPEGSRHMSS